MARFFFDFVENGRFSRDPHGTECSDYIDVRQGAMHTLPEIAKSNIPTNGDKQVYTVSVRNEANITVYAATLTFSGVWMNADIPPFEEQCDYYLLITIKSVFRKQHHVVS